MSHLAVITQPGSTGAASVTGLTDPRAVIAFGVPVAGGTGDTATLPSMGIGFGTDRSGTWAQTFDTWGAASGDPTTSDYGMNQGTGSLLVYSTNAGAIDMEIDGTQFTSTQFDYNWTNLHTTASVRGFMLILDAGDGIDDAHTIQDRFTAASGAEDITVIAGFGQPTCVLGMSHWSLAGAVAGIWLSSLGWADNASTPNQRSGAIRGNEVGTVALGAIQQAAFLDFISATFTNSISATMAATSGWPTDGFEVSKTASPGSQADAVYLALKGSGLQVAIGSFNTLTSNGDQDISLGFTPTAVLFRSNGIPANASVDTTHAALGCWMFGAIAENAQGCVHMREDDNNANQRVRSRHDETNCISIFDQAGTTGTAAVEATGALETNNIGLTYTTTSATAREIQYLALGPATVAAAEIPDVVHAVS